MKAVVAAFNQEKALVGAFSVIMNLRMELFEALLATITGLRAEIITSLAMAWNTAHQDNMIQLFKTHLQENV